MLRDPAFFDAIIARCFAASLMFPDQLNDDVNVTGLAQ